MSSDPAAVPDPAASAPTPAKDKDPGKSPESAVKFTRTAALWTALIAGFLILILLLVFILQNGDDVTLQLFSWRLTMQKGVAILLSAVAGGLLTFAVASVRMLQLRRAARKNLQAGL
jgi:uncharacterized integral membrane protein